jgi:3',5'-cyclic AMP phosphodiesterase CpdA
LVTDGRSDGQTVGRSGGRSILHLSDLHFGGRADLAQIEALERLVPELAPAAVVISGDVSQRARHGEFQRALVFVEACRRVAPTLIVPGNHDVSWWASPFGIRGRGPLYRKYRRYFGDELGPVLQLPGIVIAGAVSANGLAAGSVTWNPRDLTVKGHLPKPDTDRATAVFGRTDPGLLRVLVLHHNVLRGQISNRWGLAHPLDAQRRVLASGADLVLCGHDHQEWIGQIERHTVVAASSTHTSMTRGKRPSAFNLIEFDSQWLRLRFMRWRRNGGAFEPADAFEFARGTTRRPPQ